MTRMRLKTEMYSYQKKAVEKLSHVKVGALFMDMGIGKTRVALELIYKRLLAGKITHVIWLCPCTVIDTGSFARELKKQCDIDPHLITVCGIESLSTSYRLNCAMMNLAVQEKCYLIVDESLLVKNPYALRSQNITRLAEICEYKLILNGTPISKNEPDLFQQFYILDWRILGYRSYWSFSANHIEYDEKFKGKIRRVLNIDYLTDKIAPFTVEIRKENEEIQKEIGLLLPPKNYFMRMFILPEEQREEYNRVKEDFLSLESYESNFETPIMYRTFNALQQVATGEVIATKAYEAPISHYRMYPNVLDNPRIYDCANTLDEFGREKVVLWCKYKHELESLTKMIEYEFGMRPSICHGSMSKRQKKIAVDNFANKTQFFIATKSCASFGLNLQFCHNEIFYNNDWDWATRMQAEDRVHRIDQKYPVNIVDVLGNRTIDERILMSMNRKESISDNFKSRIEIKNYADWLDGKDELDDTDWADRKAKAKVYSKTC